MSELEQAIGYRFVDRDLLLQALTHKSFSNESPGNAPHNERLEFLGDAVLDLVISQELFVRHPDLPEGELTRFRAEAVSERSLAALARRLGLGPLLRLGRGEARSGGADKDSLLADALEALIGAIFSDGGYPATKGTVLPLFEERLEISARAVVGTDFKTRLQELFQARYGHPPDYVLTHVEGPDHQRKYTVEVRLEGRTIGCGRGRTKKGAEQAAAEEALLKQGG